MEDLITNETLYAILRKEKHRPELQKLDRGFYKKVIGYLKEKNQILKSQEEKSDNVFAAEEIKKTKKQLDSVTRLLRELYEKREGKILKLALMSSRVEEEQEANLLPEEREMLLALMEKLDYYRENMLKSVIKGKFPQLLEKPKALKREKEKEEGKEKGVLVEFLDNVPSFLGPDQEHLGPFEKGEKAKLPPEIANIFTSIGKARK